LINLPIPPALAVTFEGHAEFNGVPLFAPIKLVLEAQQWTCLLGGSGTGKSTILRLIAGLDTGANFTGRIYSSDGGQVYKRIAYMAQDDLLLPWATVKRNITLGALLRGRKHDNLRLEQLMERIGLTQHANKKPGQLSGGQRQRAALARTLMEDKPVVLLDEPFSALDAKTRMQMQDLAVELLVGRTVLIVTHDPGEASRLAHSIAILSPRGLDLRQPPISSIPRPIDDLGSLEFHASLIRDLMSGES